MIGNIWIYDRLALTDGVPTIVILLLSVITLIAFGAVLCVICQLRKISNELEKRVEERTIELTLLNKQLEEEMAERKEAESTLRDQNEYFFALHETTLTLLKRLDLDELLTEIVRKAALLVGTNHGYLFVVERGSNTMVMRAGVGLFESEVGCRRKRGEGLTGHAWELGMPLNVPDYRSWSGHLPGHDSLHAMVTIPLQISQQILGFIGLAHTEEGLIFAAEELALLERFGALAAVALENARLYTSAQQELAERQRAEESLRYSEEHLRLALSASYIATWEMYIPSKKMTWSESTEKILGLPPGSFDGTREAFRASVHLDDLEILDEGFLQAVNDGVPYNVEYRIVWPDESIRWLVGQGQLFRDAIGQPERLMGTILDITERKRATEEIDRWFNLSVDMVAIAGPDGYLKRINPAFHQILGYNQIELLIKPFLDFVHPDDIPATLAEIEKLTQGKPSIQFENRYRCQDGSYKWLSWTAAPTPEGTLYTIARDITEHKKAQELLRQSQRRLSLLVQQSPIAIIEWNLNFAVREWSLAAEKIFAYCREEAVGRHASFIVSEAVRPYVDGVFQSLLTQSGGTNSVNENLTADGRLISCQWYNAPLVDSDGTVLGVVSLVEEVMGR